MTDATQNSDENGKFKENEIFNAISTTNGLYERTQKTTYLEHVDEVIGVWHQSQAWP